MTRPPKTQPRGSLDFNGAELRRLRTERGMSQYDLARAVWPDRRPRIPQSRISGYECGAATPQPPLLRRLAQALGVHPLDLLDPSAYGGPLIAHHRAAAGLGITAAARHAGWSSYTYSLWERGSIRKLRRPDKSALAALYGITIPRLEDAIRRTALHHQS